jgi:hypothetical protein
MLRAWSPYQVQVHYVDSSHITVTDKYTGLRTTTDTVIIKDTSYLASDCQRNSIYQFKGSGIQTITDACNPSTPAYNCNWGFTQDQQLYFSQFIFGTVYNIGRLSEVDASRFAFNTVLNQYAFGNYTNAGGSSVSTYDAFITSTTLTFKNR